MKVIIEREAQQEIEAAAWYYSKKEEKLPERLTKDLLELVEQILVYPEAGRKQRGGFRRRLLKDFPYIVIYRIEPDAIRVVAFAHNKRRPGYRRRRLRRARGQGNE